MKTSGLILAAAVLAVLGGVLYWSNRREADKAAAGGTPEAPRIINLKSDDVTRVEILHNPTEKITLVKHDSGNWQVAQTPVLPGESGTMSTVLSAVSTLNSGANRRRKTGRPGSQAWRSPRLKRRSALRTASPANSCWAIARRQAQARLPDGSQRSATFYRFELCENDSGQARAGFCRQEALRLRLRFPEESGSQHRPQGPTPLRSTATIGKWGTPRWTRPASNR